MNRRDKLKVITEANNKLEQSYLKSKCLIKEEQFVDEIKTNLLNEADSSLMGGIAKNIYLYLKKMKPNNPVDINGSTLKNVKGDDITHDRKVAADYQNPSVGMDKFVKQGKAKRLGGKEIGGNEVSLSYFGNQILALGFVKKEEAQKVLDEVLKKYSKQVTGEIQTDKMSYDWAKHYAPTYTLKITMKGDKELAKSQSAKPKPEEQQ